MKRDRSMWWQKRREDLKVLCADSFPIIVYDEETLNELFFDLLSMDSIDRHLYSIAVNPYPGIIKKAFETGLDFLVGTKEEMNHVEASCPGIKPDRFFLAQEPLSFPRISIRDRSGNQQEIPESDSWDIQDCINGIEEIREERPDSEIWFVCGARDLSPVGVIITRVTGKTEGQDYFLAQLGKGVLNRIDSARGTISREIFNLSGLDRELTPLQCLLEKNGEKDEVRCLVKAVPGLGCGDLVLIPGMGACLCLEKGDMSLTRVNEAGELFLRARRMCPVRI